MKPIDNSFFDSKRSWSRIKDRILRTYLPPYLSKTQRLGRPIVIVDCFAGQGKFGDGSPGSPLIICQQIKQHAPGRATAFFVNKRPSHHRALNETLGGFIEAGLARPVLSKSDTFLSELSPLLQKQTLLLYLDPFGIKGCTFTAIETLLKRGGTASTEILMTLSMPVLHRMAARNSAHGITAKFHAVLDAVLGNVTWRHIMFDDSIDAVEKEERIIAAYCNQLRTHIRFACACPVRDTHASRVKYYVVFASRHPDALDLMNDIMLDSYYDHTFTRERENLPLFQEILDDWRSTRDHERSKLIEVVTLTLRRTGPLSRKALWQEIIASNFMKYRSAEFREAVRALVISGVIVSNQAGRLSDTSLLRIAPQRASVSSGKEQLLKRSS